MINAPCLECNSRYLGCHDNCTSYKEFKDTKEQIRVAREGFLKERSIAVESACRQRKHKNH